MTIVLHRRDHLGGDGVPEGSGLNTLKSRYNPDFLAVTTEACVTPLCCMVTR